MTDAEKWFELSIWATRYTILITQKNTWSGISGVVLVLGLGTLVQADGKTLDECVEKVVEWMKGRKEDEKDL